MCTVIAVELFVVICPELLLRRGCVTVLAGTCHISVPAALLAAAGFDLELMRVVAVDAAPALEHHEHLVGELHVSGHLNVGHLHALHLRHDQLERHLRADRDVHERGFTIDQGQTVVGLPRAGEDHPVLGLNPYATGLLSVSHTHHFGVGVLGESVEALENDTIVIDGVGRNTARLLLTIVLLHHVRETHPWLEVPEDMVYRGDVDIREIAVLVGDERPDLSADDLHNGDAADEAFPGGVLQQLCWPYDVLILARVPVRVQLHLHLVSNIAPDPRREKHTVTGNTNT